MSQVVEPLEPMQPVETVERGNVRAEHARQDGNRRPIVQWTAAGLLVLGLFLAGVFAAGALEIGTAYKAKMLCSEVFVAGRRAADVLAELDTDDLELLRVIAGRVDPAARAASASFLGLLTRAARFRPGEGCAIVFEGDAAGGSKDPPLRQPVQRQTAGPTDVPGPRAAEDPPLRQPVVPQPERPADVGAGLQTRPGLSDHTLADSGVQAVVDDAFAEPDPARPRRTRVVIVVRNGSIVAERYAPGFTADTPLVGWSMTKTALNALVGVLVREGKLALDRPVPVPEWRGDARSRITLDHLLRMTSGLRFDETMTTPVTDVTTMLLDRSDMASFAIDQPLDAEPGTRFQYSSGTSVILSRVVRTVVGETAYRTFARAALFDRLGMTGAIIETDASGTLVGSSLMYATARDWARLGLLYLQDGVWNGERILPEGWVEFSRTRTAADTTGSFGAHLWLRIAPNYNPANTPLPPDTFHAIGHEGQFVTVVPSRGVVVVRLGKTRYPGAWDHAAFVSRVLAAAPAPAAARAMKATLR